jgi:hypothetical protein
MSPIPRTIGTGCASPHPKQADVLVADIGSTITKLSAFGSLGDADGSCPQPTPCFLGQGLALTTVAGGDVVLGLETARGEDAQHERTIRYHQP